ncbi:unnamed protein product, partial [Prorocentrum cordatum]
VHQPREVFYTLAKYREKIGDPKKTKAKIVKINVKKKGIMQGVIVREGEDGVYPITRSLVIDVTKEYTLDDGSAVLDEAQLDDMMDIGSEAEEVAAAVEDSSFPAVPSSGVQTLDQAFKNKAKAEKGDDEDAGPSEKSSEKGSGGTSGSSSSDQSQSESENEGDGKDGDDGNDVLKRRRLSAKSEAKSTAYKGTKSIAGGTVAGGRPSKGGARSSAPAKKADTAKPEGGDDDDMSDGEPDAEATNIISTANESLKNFSEGKYAKTKGRELQKILRDWKTLSASGNTAWRRIAVAKGRLARAQAPPLKECLTKHDAMTAFMKTMSSFPNVVFGEIESQCNKLIQAGVCPPPVMEAAITSKKIEDHLSSNALDEAIKLLSTSAAPGAAPGDARVWGIHAIADRQLQTATCQGLAIKIFAKVFTYRIAPDRTENECMKDVMPFLNMFDNISLPRAVEEDVKAIKEIVKYHDGGGFVTELKKYQLKATAAQDPKRTENAVLSTFAISKIGRSYVKEVVTACRSALKDQSTMDELARVKKQVCDLPADKAPSMEKNGLKNVADAKDTLYSVIAKMGEHKHESMCKVLKEITDQLLGRFSKYAAAGIVQIFSTADPPDECKEAQWAFIVVDW